MTVSPVPVYDAIFWPLWVLQGCGADLQAGKAFIYTQMNKISKKFILIKNNMVNKLSLLIYLLAVDTFQY